MPYSRSELVKKTGLSLKAIRVYHDKGLIKPICQSASTSGWVYADDVICTLLYIRILTDADYSLKKIKELIDKNLLIAEICNLNVLRKLEKKRKDIEGQISFIRSIMNGISPLEGIEISNISINTDNLNISNDLSHAYESCSDDSDIDEQKKVLASISFSGFLAINQLLMEKADEERVQHRCDIMQQAYDAQISEMLKSENKELGDDSDQFKAYKFAEYELQLNDPSTMSVLLQVVEHFDFVGVRNTLYDYFRKTCSSIDSFEAYYKQALDDMYAN